MRIRIGLLVVLLASPFGCMMAPETNGVNQPDSQRDTNSGGTPSNGNQNDTGQMGNDTGGTQPDDCQPEADSASFVVQGATATMNGVIDCSTPGKVRQLLADNPMLTTIILADVPGSADDEANLEAARLVRQAGLNTHVPAGPGVASGGTDFFLAGVNRTMDAGAIIGVHSWATGDEVPIQGVELKNNDPNWETNPEHTRYTDYYREIGLADPNGFYSFTLEAAPAEDIYNMTTEEKNRFGLCFPDPCP